MVPNTQPGTETGSQVDSSKTMPDQAAARLVANHEFTSFFHTNRRNTILSWTSSIVIFPAFAVATQALAELLRNTSLRPYAFLAYGLWAFALLPQLTSASHKRDWHMGFKKRGWVVFVAALSLIGFLGYDREATLSQYWFWFALYLLFFMLGRLAARRRYGPDWKSYIIMFILIVAGWWGWMNRDGIFESIIGPKSEGWFFGVLAISGGLQLWLRLLRYRDSFTSHHHNPTRGWFFTQSWMIFLTILKVISYSVLLLVAGGNRPQNHLVDGLVNSILGWISDVPFASNPLALILLSFSLMLLVADPGQFISGQVAHIRTLYRAIRHDYIYNLITPNAVPANAFNRLVYRMGQYWKNNEYTLVLVSLLVFGFVIIPAGLFFMGDDRTIDNALKLMSIGIISGFVLTLTYLTGLLFYFRPKHIIVPFTADDDTDKGLNLLAGVVTQAFVNNLRYISILLNARQVENLNLRSDPSLPVFVTSRHDQQTIDQLDSLGNIEVAKVNLPFWPVISRILAQFATTRIRGSLHKRDNNTVAISLEYNQRGGRTIGIDIAWVPENTVQDIDEGIISDITRNLAVKLILSLGRVSHLASNWESLRLFVDGLDASYLRNWRHAISCYRKVIEIEEAVRGAFGIGYYHLGAALLVQGEIDRGLEFLKRTEAFGPPMAENHYMIALALYNKHYDSLHLRRSEFADITENCYAALSLQPQFPEAVQLLGMAYYQRGKLRERTPGYRDSRPHGRGIMVDPQPRHYRADYIQACKYLRNAIVLYDRSLRSLPRDVVATETIFDEQGRLTQDRMVASHRYADALRSLRRFPEAEGFYQDVLAAFPANIQSLIDTAKIYCMSGNWQLADEYMRNQVLNHRGTAWHKSVSLYRGWALVGGLAEELTTLSKILNTLIILYSTVLSFRFKDAWEQLQERFDKEKLRYRKLLGDAVVELDYALHQFPGYDIALEQYNWLDHFNSAVRRVSRPDTTREAVRAAYRRRISPDLSMDNGPLLYYWIAWRIDANLYRYIDHRDPNKGYPFEIAGDTLAFSHDSFPEPEFARIYRRLKRHRFALKMRLLNDDRNRRTNRFTDTLVWLENGRRLRDDWVNATEIFKRQLNAYSPKEITFAERWIVDVYAEFSILCVRVLAEAGAYGLARQAADQAQKLLRQWLRRWQNIMGGFTFSNKVACFQLATLHAWHAYAIFYDRKNSVLLGNAPIGSRKLEETDLSRVFREVENAEQFIAGHTMAVFVKGLALQEREFHHEAGWDLNTLMEENSAFNPHRYAHLDEEHRTASQVVENNYPEMEGLEIFRQGERRLRDSLKKAGLRTSLYYQERVSGALQVQAVADRAAIHTKLAGVYTSLNKYMRKEFDLASEHLLQAIAVNPFRDSVESSMSALAHHLNRNDRYHEARSASEEISFRSYQLSPLRSPIMNRYEPLVFSCIVNTNLERYQYSLERSKTLIEQFNKNRFLAEQAQLTWELVKMLGKRLPRKEPRNRVLNLLLQYLKSLRDPGDDLDLHGRPDSRLAQTLVGRAYELFNAMSGQGSEAGALQEWYIDVGRQAAAIITQNAAEYVYLLCELKNNFAFNSAELGITLQAAINDASDSCETLSYLKNCNPQFIPWDLSERLAQCYDTQAWAIFRDDNGKEGLEKAFDLLIDSGLKEDPSSAIIYYHLARLYLVKLEMLWQELPLEDKAIGHVNSFTSKEVTACLRKAFLCWRQAKRLVKGGSLVARLRFVRQRMDEYRNQWNAMQVTRAGKPAKDSREPSRA